MNAVIPFPGEISKAMLDELNQYVIAEPYPFVLDLKNCKGMWLSTIEGQKLFDWAGYYGAKLIGHNHPGLYEPEYTEKLLYAANNKIANPDFLTPECLDYYRTLHNLAPKCMKNDKLEVYVVNSGAEAVENMMKYFINLHHYKNAERGKKSTIHRFVYFDKAFHGRTIFALNVTKLPHAPVITRDFEGLFDANIQVPFPAVINSILKEENHRAMEQSLEMIQEAFEKYSDEIVGVIVEPIQGAGGHRVAYKEFFRRLSQLCHDYDVYLGFDEVQTAGGQTGTFFAIDSFDLPYPPQGLASGKKMGNGVIYMYKHMPDCGVLDSTWGGTLADMVRFCQEMKIIEREKLIEQVPEKTELLLAGLQSLHDSYPDKMFNIRGMGLYQGFSVKGDERRNNLLDIAMQEQNLLLLGAGTITVRLRPVIDVTKEDIALLIEKLNYCFEKI
jgi:L-lysine 6-transaminase